MMFGKCQGVSGHSGQHWNYGPSGDYRWSSERENLEPHEIAGGMTPPDHKDYVHPKEMAKDYYMSHYEDSDVVDSELIEKLENDEYIGPNVSINRPVK